MQVISLLDYLLLPFYILIIYAVAINIRNAYYPPGHPWRPYFIPGLTFKIIGAIFIGFIYQYYYGGGDTFLYFLQAKVVNQAIAENPLKGFTLLMHIPQNYDGAYQMYISQMEWYAGTNMYFVIAIAAFFNLFTFSTFLPTSVIFAFVSFSGMWAMFRTFAQQYPKLTPQIAIAVLFIPSSYIWGSGIFKDTVCMFGLGWMTYCVFQLLIKRNFSISNIIYLLLSFYILAIVKIYILLAFLPAIALWLVFTYSSRIKSKAMQTVIKFSLVIFAFIALVGMSMAFEKEMGIYSLDNIAKTAETTRKYVYDMAEQMDGSSYDLGEIDPSPLGLLKVFPKALVISLFGPFLWESRKIIIFVNSIEATLFLFVFLRILFRIGIKTFWKTIKADANVQFFLIFTIIYGFAVGLTSGNYGTLSRYRIPLIPFFAMALIIIYYKSNKTKNKPFFGFFGL